MKRYLTLMVIPHNKSHVREFHLTRLIIWSAAGCLGLVFCALIFYAFGYYNTVYKKNEAAYIQTENAELKRQFTFLQEKLDNMRHQIEQLGEKDRMMRAWVELSEPGDDVRQMGVGGVSQDIPDWEGHISADISTTLTETYTSMNHLLREAQFLETSFDTILTRLSHNEKLRQHLPSISPVHGDTPWLTSHFGYRRDPFTGLRQFHNGIDLAGWPGTSIVATADGVVDQVGFDKLLGYHIRINHGYGLQTLYAHLQKKPPLQEGAHVKRGGKIGEMGKTGRATATHVHYSVYKNGRNEDPQKYIFYDTRVLARN